MSKFLKEETKAQFENILNIIFNVIYPPKCIFCEQILPIISKNMFCDKCIKETVIVEKNNCCKKCSGSIKTSVKYCQNCAEFDRNFEKNISVFYYIGNVRKSILRYKAFRKIQRSQHYANFMYELFQKEYSNISFDFITSVPMSKTQFMKRGFNQSHELAKYISQYSKIPYLNLLKKNKNTKTQKELSKNEREINLKGSIKFNKRRKISKVTILLIDDVCTTGATLDECSKILKENGAIEVYCLTLAHTIFTKSDLNI